LFVSCSLRCAMPALSGGEVAAWSAKFGKEPEVPTPTNLGVQEWCRKCGITFAPSLAALTRLLRKKATSMVGTKGILFIRHRIRYYLDILLSAHPARACQCVMPFGWGRENVPYSI